ncbi:pseudouridine synthase [Paenibacillus yanchengensis]|uniref:Pseudouridine synthase n=1 Tax=Paenibacillus yanchengensis TaxID=2035833 RepID=A0ABW4YK04_9BACL
MERLQKIIAQAGIASRRKSEQLIRDGLVQVNGEIVKELGVKADPAVDIITVNGQKINSEKKIYLIMNKVKGVITSLEDPQGRKTILDFLPGIKERVYPIGRLDYDTEGLLLLTNDGEFANMLTHPSYQVPKTYHATVKGVPHGTLLEKLANGVELEDGMTAPARVEYHDVDTEKKVATISITIYEGRNRQVRRMFAAIGHEVTLLKRVQYGDVTLQQLRRGKFRHLHQFEIESLLMFANKTHKVHN